MSFFFLNSISMESAYSEVRNIAALVERQAAEIEELQALVAKKDAQLAKLRSAADRMRHAFSGLSPVERAPPPPQQQQHDAEAVPQALSFSSIPALQRTISAGSAGASAQSPRVKNAARLAAKRKEKRVARKGLTLG